MHAYAPGHAAPPIEEGIGECLHHIAARVAPSGPGCWRITPTDDGKPPTLVAVDGDWIVVERTLPDCRLARLRDLRRWERRLLDLRPALPSGARPVLPAGETQVRMRAERPLPSLGWQDADGPWRWLKAALADVAAEVSADAPNNASGREEVGQPDLRALCEQAGWPATQRGASGEVAIALPGQGGDTCHAIATAQGALGRFHVALEVCAEQGVSPLSRAAVALALLRAAASVRLVRASATHTDARIVAILGVDLALPLEPERVGQALSALAVAHRHIAAELGVLARDRTLAHAYLSLQGLC